ncbi:hypothetical protein [Ruegeria arenilitoris]|uniref:hypothetical protein n=1 Tax=Ruegeria arenilitoris TaxID=1173585 RepID=UPI003C797CFD
MFGFFQNKGEKAGVEAGRSLIQFLSVNLTRYDKDLLTVPDGFLAREYLLEFIYGFATVSLRCAFRGENWSQPDKGKYIYSCFETIDPVGRHGLTAFLDDSEAFLRRLASPLGHQGLDDGSCLATIMFDNLRADATSPELEKARSLAGRGMDLSSAFMMVTIQPYLRSVFSDDCHSEQFA